jgi:predicted HicB family RNase H-like nuclease
MVQVSARIPLEDRRALKLLAAREDTSINDLVVEAIRALVRGRRKPAGGSK